MKRPFAGKKTDVVAVLRDLRGVWRTRGYGQILEIGRNGYRLYEETRISCYPVFEGSLEELAEHYADVRVSPGGQAFSARRAAGVTRLMFRRLGALPAGSPGPGSAEGRDPTLNFDVLWHTFAEHYAPFELRGVDWAAVHDEYRPKVSAGMPGRELFQLLADALSPLGDGHVHLHTPHGHFNAGGAPQVYDRLAAELDEAEDTRDVVSYLAEAREWLRDTIQETYLSSQSHHACNRLLEWGELDDTTGYLAIRAMAGHSGRVGRPRDDLEAVDAAMAHVMGQLGDRDAMVIDLRGNGGGYDIVALRLAGYFVDRKRLAYTKAARRREGFTGEQSIYVEPFGTQRFTGRVVLLTSGLTASAAEVFVLALLQRPDLTLVGEPTQGILSDALERHLPNGWLVTLSNEMYRAYDGELYENCGIPPHVTVPFLHPRDRRAGRDPMLDYAMRMSRQ